MVSLNQSVCIIGALALFSLAFIYAFTAFETPIQEEKEIISKKHTGTLAICTQFDAMPLNDKERENLDAHIFKEYGVECP